MPSESGNAITRRSRRDRNVYLRDHWHTCPRCADLCPPDSLVCPECGTPLTMTAGELDQVLRRRDELAE